MKYLKYIIPILICLLAFGFFAVGLKKTADNGSNEVVLVSPLIGKRIPDFQLQKLDFQEDVSHADIIGEKLLLNVWATWCITCEREHPALNKLSQQGVNIVGVNIKDDKNKALTWLKQRGNPYLFSISDPDGDLGLDLGVYGYPETFFIDSKGIIHHRYAGEITQENWDKQFKSIYEGML